MMREFFTCIGEAIAFATALGTIILIFIALGA